MVKKLKGRDFLAIGDLTAEELHFLLSTSIKLKKKGSSLALKGKTIALLFEKPSLRTRVSFDVAMQNRNSRESSRMASQKAVRLFCLSTLENYPFSLT